MIALACFISGLAYFSLGLAVYLEARRGGKLSFENQLPWLAGFGVTQGIAEWLDMFMLMPLDPDVWGALASAHSVLLPLSALMLMRFGVVLIVSKERDLPRWLVFAPVALLVPASIAAAYVIIVAVTSSTVATAADVWSRYLLYTPAAVLTAIGFSRGWRDLSEEFVSRMQTATTGAAVAFGVNAFVSGLIVPAAPYGPARWLNYTTVLEVTGMPVHLWRTVSAVAVTVFVVHALDLFEEQRQAQLKQLEQERYEAQQSVLRTQTQALEAAEKWTDALVSTSRRIANMDNVDQVLLRIVESSRVLLNADAAALGLWTANGTELEMKCHVTQHEQLTLNNMPPRCTFIQHVVKAYGSTPVRYPQEVSGVGAEWCCPMASREILAAAIVPLQLDDQPIGVLWAERHNGDGFTRSDLIGLCRLADQAVIALEHASMAAQLQSLAAVEERSRIAREMHDGLAQILGYLNLEMQTIAALIKQGQAEVALEEIQQAREQIQAAQADVRENIVSLRTTLNTDTDLISGLKEYVEEFGVQSGIRACFDCSVEANVQLSPMAQAQLVRILQEALANVRKHSQAKNVRVCIDAIGGLFNLSVVDDGVGITRKPGRGHFGLQTMRERAESVGGGLTITSSPGQGTQVEVWLPLMQD